MDKREQIIITAIELFAHSGFDNTSIRELSQKAGVNVAMVNYYFGSKEKLFQAMIEYKSHYLREKLEEIRSNTELNEMEKINLIIEEYVNRILSHPLYHRVLHQEILFKARPEVNATILKIFNKNSQVIKDILHEGMKKKIFRVIDPELTLASVIGTINHVMLTPTTRDLITQQSETNDPHSNDKLRKRLISHLQQLIQAHLLIHSEK